MDDDLVNAIAAETAKGTPSQQIIEKLTSAGWPRELVEPAVNQLLQFQVSNQQKSEAFKNWLQKYYDMARKSVIYVVGLNLVDTIIALAKPWPVKIMADSVFGNRPAWGPLEPYTGTVTLLAITSLMTIGLFIIGRIFGVFKDTYMLKVGFNLNRKIKEESFRHILHLPLFHKERLPKGDYVYRQNVVTSSLSELVLSTRSIIIQSILVIVGVLVIMLFINSGLTTISIFLLPMLFVTIKLIGPKMGVWARKYTENASETSSKINEAVNNAEAIQSFTLEEKMVKKVDTLWQDSYVFSRKNMLWGQLLDGTNGLLVTLATSAVMLLGGAAALRGELSFGDLLIFMTYMGYLIGPVQQLISQVTTRNQKLIDVGRIYEIMVDHEGIEYLRQDQRINQQIKGTIEFNDIRYSYHDQEILKGINFTIPAGQKVGIIGPSGGGKSTILKMLPLFLEPQAGKVTIDGIDIQSVSLRDLRKKIAWVSQTPQLFNENIFENLMEGDVDREITNEEIEHAVDVSNITEFVVKMPKAFQTPVGEDGGSLSGGQRQRISIGRALIKDAPIICLDEPTAALDVKSENYIRDSLSQIIKGKTVVMVTHRKPLLDLMDVIYVLDNGQLTDVHNLGGLDAYLARLEGIENTTASEEIRKEKTSINPTMVEKFLSAFKSAPRSESETQQEQSNSYVADYSSLNYARSNDIYVPPTGVTENNTPTVSNSPTTAYIPTEGSQPKDSDEVEIKLH